MPAVSTVITNLNYRREVQTTATMISCESGQMAERGGNSVADRNYDQKTAMMGRLPVLGPTRTHDNLMRRSSLVGLSIDDRLLKRQFKSKGYRYFRWEPCFTTQSPTADETSTPNGLRVDILKHDRHNAAPRTSTVLSKTQLENRIVEFDSDTSKNPKRNRSNRIYNIQESGNVANYNYRNLVKTKVNDKFYVNNSFVVAADKISLLLQSTPPFAVRSVHEGKSGRSEDNIRHSSDKHGGGNAARGSSPWSCSPLGTRLFLPRRFLPANAKLAGLYRANTFTAPSCSDRDKHTRIRPSGGTTGRIVLHGIKIEHSRENPPQDGTSSTQNKLIPLSLPWSVDNNLNATKMSTTKFLDMSSIKSKGDKHIVKTLTPSKHGYHPRSTSPTFKILVCASERLRESELNHLLNKKPKPSDKTYYIDSPEPDQGVLRRYNQSFNSTDDSDTTASVSSRSENDFQRFKQKSGNHKLGMEVNVLSVHSIQDGRTRSKVAHVNRNPSQGNNGLIVGLANDTHETNKDMRKETDGSILIQEDEQLIEPEGQLDNTVVVNTIPAVEVEKENGQTTHMHFFLPQIVTSMSEVSLTNHGEADNPSDRPDLTRALFNNTSETISQTDLDDSQIYAPTNYVSQGHSLKQKTKMFLPKQINRSDHDRNKPQPTRRVYIKSEPRKTKQIKIIPSSIKRISITQKVRSLPRQEQHTGSRETSSSAHSDHRLPSEKLKEEMEDFPTLVSMDYS